MNRYQLDGRAAVVTGAARGIGYGIAERLLDCGASVAVWDIDEQAAATAVEKLAEKGEAVAVRVELRDPESAARAAERSAEALGGIEILVNNAGIAGPSMPLWEYPVADWREVVEVDLLGVFHACRAAIPFILRGDYGRIVNVASVAGKEGNPNMSAYSAAKAGVIALTKSLGKELATKNVLVNCVTPATVKTEILKQFSEQQVRDNVSKVPMGRLGTIEENADLVAWLCSPGCSFSTGAVFDISGGRCTY